MSDIQQAAFKVPTQIKARSEPVPGSKSRPAAVVPPLQSPADALRAATIQVRTMWLVTTVSTIVLPVLIVMFAAAFDGVPWSPGMGAFVIAAGAIAITASFPWANQYRNLTFEIVTELERYRRLETRKLQKLMQVLIIGAACAEIPSVFGLIHLFVTGELIASLLLCVPAIALMLVVYKPTELRMTVAPE